MKKKKKKKTATTKINFTCAELRVVERWFDSVDGEKLGRQLMTKILNKLADDGYYLIKVDSRITREPAKRVLQ